MAAQNFQAILRRVLKSEGGYSNHPADPGGPTNYGITLATYQRYVKRDATAADVKAMPIETAMQIYQARYWDACGCGSLPSGVDYSIMDYAVNSGNGRATVVLRHVVGLSATAPLAQVVAELAKRDVIAVIDAINAERLAFLKSLRTWGVFGEGWSHRVAAVKVYSHTLATHGVDSPTAKAIEDKTVTTVGKATHTVSTKEKTSAAAPLAPAAAGAAYAPDWFVSHPLLSVGIAVAVIALVAFVIALLQGRAAAKQLQPMLSIPPVPPVLHAGIATVTGDVARLTKGA